MKKRNTKKQKQYRFWFHYNKPMSRQMDMAVWTVHWKNKCWQALSIKCNVDTETHERSSQPHAIVRGYAHTLEMCGPLPEKDTLFAKAYIDRYEGVRGTPQPFLIVEDPSMIPQFRGDKNPATLE